MKLIVGKSYKRRDGKIVVLIPVKGMKYTVEADGWYYNTNEQIRGHYVKPEENHYADLVERVITDTEILDYIASKVEIVQLGWKGMRPDAYIVGNQLRYMIIGYIALEEK